MRKIDTAAAQTAVFDYLSDFTSTTEWDPGTVRTELISGDGGVGTRYRNTSKFMGRETVLDYEVTEHSAPHRIVLRGENDSVVSTDTIEVEPAGGGSRVTYQAHFDFKGVMGKAEPVLKLLLWLPFKRLGDEAQAGMKDALTKL